MLGARDLCELLLELGVLGALGGMVLLAEGVTAFSSARFSAVSRVEVWSRGAE